MQMLEAYFDMISQGVSPAVLEEESRIIDEEGWYVVDNCFYPSLSDAAVQRRWLAERNVRESTRQINYLINHGVVIL